MSVNKLRLSVLCLPLLALTACGEGWEAQKTDQYFPYGNQRTAGYGVVYVRAKMMPEKELNVEPVADIVAEEPAVVVVEPELAPIQPADEVFQEAQTKGAMPAKREVAPSVAPQASPVSEAVEDEAAQMDSVVEQKQAVAPPVIEQSIAVEPSAVEIRSRVDEDEHASVPVTAEDYISQAPKQIEIPEVKIVDEPVTSAVVYKEEVLDDEKFETEPRNAVVMKSDVDNSIAPPPPSYAPASGDMEEVSSDDTIETHVKEVIAPKRSLVQDRMIGQDNLEQIYSDPL